MLLKRCAYLIIGAVLMVNFSGCSGMKFERYNSKDPSIDVSLDYPATWQHSEDRGSYGSYVQALFIPSDEKEKGRKPVMALTVRDESRVGFAPRNLTGAVDDYSARRRTFKDMNILVKSDIKIAGTEGTEMEISYIAPEDLLKIRSKMIPFKERIVIFKKDKKFYFLRYESTKEKFDEYSRAFDHVIRSVKFQP